ncbi:MAG TPA: gluconokinase [Spirillospora sp.]|nr:gluconokinase [Spirillospora sp.]
MTREVVIGLDVGTSAVKAVAFELGSAWRYSAARQCTAEPVRDPARISAAVTDALGECAAACADRRVLAVSVSTAMHGLLALDAEMRPLTPLSTWADDRAGEQAWRLRRSGQAADLHRVSGTPVHPMTPLTKLLWFRQERPDLWARARWWAGLKDYVLWRLTGDFITELSSASGTGMLDMSARDWSPDALRLTGLDRERLPRVLPTTTILELAPEPARLIGLPAGTPVVAGAGDGPLGNLGTGAMTSGVAGLSLGTSGAVRTMRAEPYSDPECGLFSYALTDTAWAIGAAVSNGGNVVRWAGELFDAPDGAHASHEAELLELAAKAPAGSDGLIMLPYLLPERAPLWRPRLRGAFLGLSERHTRGHFVRAAVEGVALRLAQIVIDLERLGPITGLRVTGGAFRSALWRDVVAAAVDRPTTFTSGAEGSALGAAALGLHALGRAAQLEDAPAMLDAAYAEGEPIAVSATDAETYRTMLSWARPLSDAVIELMAGVGKE